MEAGSSALVARNNKWDEVLLATPCGREELLTYTTGMTGLQGQWVMLNYTPGLFYVLKGHDRARIPPPGVLTGSVSWMMGTRFDHEVVPNRGSTAANLKRCYADRWTCSGPAGARSCSGQGRRYGSSIAKFDRSSSTSIRNGSGCSGSGSTETRARPRRKPYWRRKGSRRKSTAGGVGRIGRATADRDAVDKVLKGQRGQEGQEEEEEEEEKGEERQEKEEKAKEPFEQQQQQLVREEQQQLGQRPLHLLGKDGKKSKKLKPGALQMLDSEKLKQGRSALSAFAKCHPGALPADFFSAVRLKIKGAVGAVSKTSQLRDLDLSQWVSGGSSCLKETRDTREALTLATVLDAVNRHDQCRQQSS